MINDSAGIVRAAAVGRLVSVYKACAADPTPLAHFTSRFETRFVEMIMDVETAVAVEAIRLVSALKSLGMLTMQQVRTAARSRA